MYKHFGKSRCKATFCENLGLNFLYLSQNQCYTSKRCDFENRKYRALIVFVVSMCVFCHQNYKIKSKNLISGYNVFINLKGWFLSIGNC